jgi:hypothetical protein
MNDMTPENLWQEFNLAENNPDPGGGILYAIRYETDALREQQSRVIGGLVTMGVGISVGEFDNQLRVVIPETAPEQRQKAAIMLEELSVVNEALEYHVAGFDCESISELSERLKATFRSQFNNTDKVDAYDLATIAIPQIVGNILAAHEQNGVLSKEEVVTVLGLRDFAGEKEALLDGSHGIVVLGRSGV